MTGFTPPSDRESWIALGESMVRAATPYFSADRSLIAGPGTPSRHGARSDGVEGFARVFLLHALLGAAHPGAPVGTEDMPFLEGLAEGVRTTWPRVSDTRHMVVEAASIATALWVGDCRLWNELDPDTQDQLVDWLSAAAQSSLRSFNNWQLFGAIIAAFLAAVDRAQHTAGVLATALSTANSLYRDDGWYSDGEGSAFDYYNSFSFHYYLPLIAHLAGDNELRAAVRERSALFAHQLETLIGSDGAPVYFGRSLTYRFGIASAFSTAALLDAVDEPASYRALSEANVAYFVRGGAFHSDGLLHRGWFGADDSVVQAYSGPMASYWASKVFVNLLLPADHGYWGAPAPRPPAGVPRRLAVPNFVVVASANRDVVRLANHGSFDHVRTDVARVADDPHYSRLSYSSVSAPATTPDARDMSFTIVTSRGRWGRARVESLGGGADWASSTTAMRCDASRGIVDRMLVRLLRSRLSRLVPQGRRNRAGYLTVSRGNWDVHLFVAPRALRRRAQRVTFGGWAVADSALVALGGFTGASVSPVQGRDPFEHTVAVPFVWADRPATRVFGAAASLRANGEAAPRLSVGDGGVLRLEWADGYTHEVVRRGIRLQMRN